MRVSPETILTRYRASSEELSLGGDAARRGDCVERLRDVFEGEWLALTRRVADELAGDVAEIGVALVGRGHVLAVLARTFQENVRQRAPANGQDAFVLAGERRPGEEPRGDLEVGVLERAHVARQGGVFFELLGRRAHRVGGRDPVRESCFHRPVLELIIVILLVLWLLGYFGPARIPSIPQSGNLIHVLLVIAVILLILRLL